MVEEAVDADIEGSTSPSRLFTYGTAGGSGAEFGDDTPVADVTSNARQYR
jgi:hypothetical protein